MQVVVNKQRCEGHGQCEDAAPEVFRVEDDGLAHVLIDHPGEELRVQVEEAARRCPAEAITVQG